MTSCPLPSLISFGCLWWLMGSSCLLTTCLLLPPCFADTAPSHLSQQLILVQKCSIAIKKTKGCLHVHVLIHVICNVRQAWLIKPQYLHWEGASHFKKIIWWEAFLMQFLLQKIFRNDVCCCSFPVIYPWESAIIIFSLESSCTVTCWRKQRSITKNRSGRVGRSFSIYGTF